MKELYINGKLVELDSKTRLDLQFKSFLFSGISELTAPRSWTVSLPKSASNLALIEGSNSGDSDSNFPYNNYVVDYYSKGYRVINQGKGILIKITERIEFTFTFGKAYEAIKAMTEKRLTELPETETDKIVWDINRDYNDMDSGVGWCNWYNYTNEDRSFEVVLNNFIPTAVTHPTVTFKYLIDKIETEFSVDMTALSSLPKMDKYAIPIRKLNGKSSLISDSSFQSAPTSIGALTNIVNCTNSNHIEVNITENYKHTVTQLITEPITMQLTWDIRTSPQVNTALLQLIVNDQIIVEDTDSSTDPLFERYQGFKNIEVKAGDIYYFKFNVQRTLYTPSGVNGSSITNKMFYNTSIYRKKFFIIPNLPDITCSDFIFQAMQIAGVFPSISNDNPNVIDFINASELYDNLTIAKNWTNKLVKSNARMSDLSDVAFKFGNYSKKNILKYKDDETNALNTSSYLSVDNQNLEDESNLVSLSFSAAKRHAGTFDKTADYPLYDIKIVSGELFRTYKEPKNDIIAEIVNVNNINYLQFTDNLLWSNLKTANYTGYQSLILKPRYIREKFYLKQEDVTDIKLEIPIYLEQYGKYYAIMVLQYKEDEISECELLEIKNI
jgi:hypothetical protein